MAIPASSSPKLRGAAPPSDGLALLRSHPVFGALDPAQLERLAAYAHQRRVTAGKTIFTKGDPGTALFAVCTGSVSITVPSIDGREAMFNIIHPGEIFGEIALLDGRPRTADAVAMTDCELKVIERKDFLSFVHGEPIVAMKLIELLCTRLRWASEHFEEVVFLNLPARLARLLLRLAEQDPKAPKPRRLKITQLEIGHMLGSTRESVNKQLRAWTKRGWVAVGRNGVTLLAPDALAAIAGGTGDNERSGARPAQR